MVIVCGMKVGGGRPELVAAQITCSFDRFVNAEGDDDDDDDADTWVAPAA